MVQYSGAKKLKGAIRTPIFS